MERIYPRCTLLNFVLKNSLPKDVKKAVKAFNVLQLGYNLKQCVINEYPNYRGRDLYFGIELLEDLKPYLVDIEKLSTINKEIDKCRRLMKLFGKYHSQYIELAVKHDELVNISNQLCQPITMFIVDYQKAQKEIGVKIKIRNYKEKIKIPKK
jgi:hypothetical protein